jgi:hypothetical protein
MCRPTDRAIVWTAWLKDCPYHLILREYSCQVECVLRANTLLFSTIVTAIFRCTISAHCLVSPLQPAPVATPSFPSTLTACQFHWAFALNLRSYFFFDFPRWEKWGVILSSFGGDFYLVVQKQRAVPCYCGIVIGLKCDGGVFIVIDCFVIVTWWCICLRSVALKPPVNHH